MMKSCKIFFAIVLLFLVGCFAGAQETVVLTLEKSIEIALSQNPYHLASEERVAAASSQVRAAAANFFPTIEAQGLHTLDEKLFELEFPSFIPGEPPERVAIDFTKDYQFSLSVSLPLFTGRCSTQKELSMDIFWQRSLSAWQKKLLRLLRNS
jgi:outer membrane protein